MYDIGVVIPVYNGERTLSTVVREVRNCLHGLGISSFIILMDDSSTDGTPYLIENLSLRDERITAVYLEPGARHGSAERPPLWPAGDSSPMQVYGTMDDDSQHPVELLGKLLDKIREGYDLVYVIRRGDSRPLIPSDREPDARWVLFSADRHSRGIEVSSYRRNFDR